jgi:hypothetical protein
MNHQREEIGYRIEQLVTLIPDKVGATSLWILFGEKLEWFWSVRLSTKIGVVTAVYMAGMLVGIFLVALLP